MSPPLVLVMWGHRRCPMVAPAYFGTGRSMPAANTEISAQIAACRKKQIGCLAAMAGIARKIELYNLVYRLAGNTFPSIKGASSQILLGIFMNPSGARSMRGQPKLFSLPPRRSGILRKARRCREQTMRYFEARLVGEH